MCRPRPSDRPGPRDPSRRQALALLAGGLTALAASACAPARILLQDYPEAYRTDDEVTGATLCALVQTVVPGMHPGDPRAVGVLRDRFYPLAPYAAFLASDLDRRARHHRGSTFAELPPRGRAEIFRRGLGSRDETTRKLYAGAAFLAQVAVYGGVYDDRAGCPLIEFPGGYTLIPRTALPPSLAARHVPPSMSRDGNPA